MDCLNLPFAPCLKLHSATSPILLRWHLPFFSIALVNHFYTWCLTLIHVSSSLTCISVQRETNFQSASPPVFWTLMFVFITNMHLTKQNYHCSLYNVWNEYFALESCAFFALCKYFLLTIFLHNVHSLYLNDSCSLRAFKNSNH